MDRIWRSKTVLEPKVVPKAELLLPNQIGCRIIELEMEIDEGKLTKQLIIDLNQEYTKAVQFYEEKQDERYKLYKRKIQNLLQKPAVDLILKQGSKRQGKSTNVHANMMLKKEKAQEEIRKASTQNKTVVKKMLEFSAEEAEKQKKIIKKQLDHQLQDLEERIQRKRINSERGKKKNMSMSFSVSSTQPDVALMTDFQEVPAPSGKSKVFM